MAHYDSVPIGSGAADNGIGTATLLEIARAVKDEVAGYPHPLRFLFTDAEEVGLIGAQAFLDQHPWSQDVAVVINAEARGSKGVSMMFEASEGNSCLVDELSAALPRPVATSAFYETYRRMPNDTDFSPFKEAGIQGVNFSNIGGVESYHTRLDILSRLSLGTLQHEGDNVLALARALVNRTDPTCESDHDVVFFDILALGIVKWPLSWTFALSLVVLLVFLAAVILRYAQDRVRFRAGLVGSLLAVGVFFLPHYWGTSFRSS